jgi:hypothetical protein
MTITLEVSDEIADRLATDARKAGLTIAKLQAKGFMAALRSRNCRRTCAKERNEALALSLRPTMIVVAGPPGNGGTAHQNLRSSGSTIHA